MIKKLCIPYLICLCYCIVAHAQIDSISLHFVGDAMQHKSQLDDAKNKDGTYDYSKYFAHLKDNIRKADFAIVNLETPIGIKPYTGYPNFSAPIQFAEALKDAGFDVFLTANNHAVDKGKRGIIKTIDLLDSLKVMHTGTFTDGGERSVYYPLMLIKKDIRIAMLNCTYGTNGISVPEPTVVNFIDTVQIKKDIATAWELGADIIVANMHWGFEYKLYNSKVQKKLADFLVRNGVRLVIGGHPHVVQPVEMQYNDDGAIDAIVVYSLGNYISGMRTIDTSGGMTVDIQLSKEPGKKVSIDSFDYSLIWTYKPTVNDRYTNFQLLPVADFLNAGGQEKLGEDYKEMETFAKNAKNAIEKNW